MNMGFSFGILGLMLVGSLYGADGGGAADESDSGTGVVRREKCARSDSNETDSKQYRVWHHGLWIAGNSTKEVLTEDFDFGDNEFAALSARADRTHGFQGCVNQATCGETGFYGAIYSAEGFCKYCNFERFPSRFVACLFCRTPNTKVNASLTSLSCLSCFSQAEELIVKKFVAPDGDRLTLEIGAGAAMNQADYTVVRKFIPALKKFKTRDAVFPMTQEHKTPRIYRGAIPQADGSLKHVWVGNIETDPADRKVTARGEETQAHVTALCEKYDIFGPETGTIISTMPENVVATYTEKRPE